MYYDDHPNDVAMREYAYIGRRTGLRILAIPRGSPRTDKPIAASIQWAKKIMKKIDCEGAERPCVSDPLWASQGNHTRSRVPSPLERQFRRPSDQAVLRWRGAGRPTGRSSCPIYPMRLRTACNTYPLTVRRSRFAAARIVSASSQLHRISRAVRLWGFIGFASSRADQ